MRALIDDLARLQHQDTVGPANLAQAMRDEERRPLLADAIHGLLDAIFGGARNVDFQTARSYAAFSELYWTFLDRTTLTLGGRYTRDDKRIRRAYFQTATAAAPLAVLPPGDDDYAESKFTPKVGIDWRATDDILLYANWGRGYKAGGFAAARPTSVAQLAGQVVAETVDSVEAGVKSEWFDRRLRLNLTLFGATYDDLQSSVLGADGSFNVISGDAEFRGAELESVLRPTAGWNIYALVGLLDAEWSRQPVGIPTAVKLKHAPRVHYKVGMDYETRPIGPGRLRFAANYRHSDEIFRSTANHRNILSPAYGVWDAQLAYELLDGRWRVTVAGENLGDKLYYTQGVSTLGRYVGEPRTWSLTLKASY